MSYRIAPAFTPEVKLIFLFMETRIVDELMM
jgi:hypothetical protein